MSEDFSSWVGRRVEADDVLEPARTKALRAAFGDPLAAGKPLPHLHHWLYFWDVQPPQSLGPDGHPARGGFLPPVPLPRRMWAGGRVTFLKPLLIGERVKRTSTILKVEEKSGKSGHLVFVTVQHEVSGQNGTALVEEQDIVYREAAAAGSVSAPGKDIEPDATPWRWDVVPDPILLFRYSALTMNGHRIHYDRPYAMQEEAYPGLVVHGPLQATLLAQLAARHLKAPLATFAFRGQSPAFDGATLHVCGAPSDEGGNLWTEQAGKTCMTATVTIRA
jgi:3-methylfumaryl-CoA hydratase